MSKLFLKSRLLSNISSDASLMLEFDVRVPLAVDKVTVGRVGVPVRAAHRVVAAFGVPYFKALCIPDSC